jgi:hypothetical protein
LEGEFAMRKFLAALVIAASTSALAADLAIDDILGTWCVDNGNKNVFTRNAMTVVFPNGGKRVLKIEKISVENNLLGVLWTKETASAAGMKGRYTEYDLSADKRTLAQVANTGGDMGRRYELKRC